MRLITYTWCNEAGDDWDTAALAIVSDDEAEVIVAKLRTDLEQGRTAYVVAHSAWAAASEEESARIVTDEGHARWSREHIERHLDWGKSNPQPMESDFQVRTLGLVIEPRSGWSIDCEPIEQLTLVS